jgi:isopentenyl-diphosphate Delta-isomerase
VRGLNPRKSIVTDRDNAARPGNRKVDHVQLCVEENVEAKHKTTLLEEVDLVHRALPELALDEVDLTVEVLGKTLSAPLLITGMTGGDSSVRQINRGLASVARDLGIAFGVGSQRPLLDKPHLLDTYQVRDIAPEVLLFGNIGAVQATTLSTTEANDLVSAIDADALCVHLNAAQELTQPEGDRDFRGCVDAITRLSSELRVPVIVKETGCGLDPHSLRLIWNAGVRWVDVSGAGGTSWVAVETLRRKRDDRSTGYQMWDWGIPTAASILFARDQGFHIIGSGGLRTGVDAVKALALGASLAGMALPWIRAFQEGGVEEATCFGRDVLDLMRQLYCLTGSSNIDALQHAPKLLGPRLRRWLEINP